LQCFFVSLPKISPLSIPNLDIQQYDYSLPEEKIALYPLKRGESKLLVYDNQVIKEDLYQNIDEYLDPKSLLVFNETKVVQARLLFPKNESTIIEIFCLEPAHNKPIEQALTEKGSLEYTCLIGGARKWKSGLLSIVLEGVSLQAEKLDRNEDSFLVRFSWKADISFAEVLDLAGKTPLPPYIKRKAEENDKKTYQTVYANRAGSVAAPTAGLHFNHLIFNKLADKGIHKDFLTLHVGAGTFKPVSTSVMEHEMHAEELIIEYSFIKRILGNLKDGREIISVGTTSVRALESMYWLGCLYKAGQILRLNDICIPQWISYKGETPRLEASVALESCLQLLKENEMQWLSIKTQIIIAPGYQHGIIKGLITNFHQPKSTLMLLVSSIVGEDWYKIYNYALSNNFRFLSYGDGCLLKL
jgi:S-adenosylmethionine:tRNA ribosyltransferase-isomerase